MSTHADLHLHSSFSDGLLPPREVVARVQAAGLKAFSLTDHDTLAGHEEARDAAGNLGLEFIPGVELSLAYKGQPLHLLAYGDLEGSDELEAVLRVARSRQKRFLEAFCRSLTSREVLVHFDELRNLPLRRALHALKVLVLSTRKKDARSVWKASRLEATAALGPRLDAARVLDVLRNRGLILSWAHPLIEPSPMGRGQGEGIPSHSKGPEGRLELLPDLIAHGLSAIEVYHGLQGSSQREALATAAAKTGLAATGGSDCHFRAGWPKLGEGGLVLDQYSSFRESLSLGRGTGRGP